MIKTTGSRAESNGLGLCRALQRAKQEQRKLHTHQFQAYEQGGDKTVSSDVQVTCPPFFFPFYSGSHLVGTLEKYDWVFKLPVLKYFVSFLQAI